MTTTEKLIYLMACAVNQVQADKEKLELNTVEDYEAVFKLAEFHSVSVMVACALENMDGIEPKIAEKCKSLKLKNIRKTMLFDAERAKLEKFMDENSIWYVPLKGIIINKFYPVYGMREFSDNDILFDCKNGKGQFVRDFFVSNGYKVENFDNGVHDEYMKAPVFNFEMHRQIVSDYLDDKISPYYKNVLEWSEYSNYPNLHKLHKEKGSFKYCFSDEDFYVYFVVHAWKHCQNGGTGLRTLADVYTYLKMFQNLDFEYIKNETRKLGIYDFEQSLKSLGFDLLNKPSVQISIKDTDKKIFEYIVGSGVYGNVKNLVENRMNKQFDDGVTQSNKLKYMFRRLFPDRLWMEHFSPKYGKYLINLPWLYVYRIWRILFTKEGKERLNGELDAIEKLKS